MGAFARIRDGSVVEFFTTPAGKGIADCFAPSLVWVDVSGNPGVREGWKFDGVTFTAPVAPPAPPSPSQITPLAFIARFTLAEQTLIATAAMGNVALWLWFNKMTAATHIDLLGAEAIAGVSALVAAGLISEARKLAILTP